MQRANATVVQLPTELYRLRESDRLIKEWGRIQQLSEQDRVVALFSWYSQMEAHLDKAI